LRTEALTKNKALMKVRAEFQALCNERDQYQNEINKCAYLERTKLDSHHFCILLQQLFVRSLTNRQLNFRN